MVDPAPQIPSQLTLDDVDHAFNPVDQVDHSDHAADDALAKFRERTRDRLRARGGMG